MHIIGLTDPRLVIVNSESDSVLNHKIIKYTLSLSFPCMYYTDIKHKIYTIRFTHGMHTPLSHTHTQIHRHTHSLTPSLQCISHLLSSSLHQTIFSSLYLCQKWTHSCPSLRHFLSVVVVSRHKTYFNTISNRNFRHVLS